MDQTLYNLMLQEARFLLGAEQEQATRMRELAECIADPGLRALFDAHAEETDSQIDRLQEILRAAGEDGEGDVPGGIVGMIDDAEMMAEMDLGQPAQDAAILSAGRKMEHYEIGCYQSVIVLAEQLGLEDMVEPLRHSLVEEKRADQRLASALLTLLQGVEVES